MCLARTGPMPCSVCSVMALALFISRWVCVGWLSLLLGVARSLSSLSFVWQAACCSRRLWCLSAREVVSELIMRSRSTTVPFVSMCEVPKCCLMWCLIFSSMGLLLCGCIFGFLWVMVLSRSLCRGVVLLVC